MPSVCRHKGIWNGLLCAAGDTWDGAATLKSSWWYLVLLSIGTHDDQAILLLVSVLKRLTEVHMGQVQVGHSALFVVSGHRNGSGCLSPGKRWARCTGYTNQTVTQQQG